jgi:hypothetical protein
MSRLTTTHKGNVVRRSSAARLFSVGGSFGEVQIVAGHDLLFDLQARIYDVFGRRHVSHATALLPIEEAIRLETVLGEALRAVH